MSYIQPSHLHTMLIKRNLSKCLRFRTPPSLYYPTPSPKPKRKQENKLLTGYLALLFSDLCLDSKVEVSPEAQEAAAEFVEAIFAVLSSLNNIPRALARVLEGYLERSHLWDHFCSLAGKKKKEKRSTFSLIRNQVSYNVHALSLIHASSSLLCP